MNQQGNYKCKIYQNNRDGSFRSEIFTELVSVTMMSTAVVIEEQPQPTLYVKEGEKLTLSCKANSHPLPRFQWYRDNTKLEKQTSQILCVNICFKSKSILIHFFNLLDFLY